MKALFSAAAVCLAAAGLVSAEGRVRVVHASPDASKVDIRVDGQPALDAIPFGASTGYVPVPDGPHTFAIYVAGTDTLVTSVEATIAPNASYTVAAVGFAGGQNPGFRVILLPDNRDEPPPGPAISALFMPPLQPRRLTSMQGWPGSMRPCRAACPCWRIFPSALRRDTFGSRLARTTLA